VRPELEGAGLHKPLTMLLFGMMNWLFTWLRPGGPLTHEAMSGVVADLFFGGLPAVQTPAPAKAPRRQVGRQAAHAESAGPCGTGSQTERSRTGSVNRWERPA
jgi:hypothetical protein